MLKLPDNCLKGLSNCSPLGQIQSDESPPKSFICCGESDLKTRERENDCFRLCFVNELLDCCSDNDMHDLIDLTSVICQAISAKMNEIFNKHEISF